LEILARDAVQAAQSIAESHDAHPVNDARAVNDDVKSERRRTPRGPVPKIKAASFGTVALGPILPSGSRKKTWVDLQNDVKVSDIDLAVRENYIGVEHLKRYTTLGMGTDQGRTSNVNGIAVLAALTSRDMSEVGTTTFRPPYAAVRMATIANGRRGNLYRPRRYLGAHAVHREWGAAMEDFGWERPDWYRVNGTDRQAAVASEMRAVREHVGVFDGSSLGKIEITGPDARKFVAKFYVSNMANLEPGRIRYSVMLREDGVIFDDGVVTCIAEDHFLASTTSGNAEQVAAWFDRWRQTEWPMLRVAVSTVTDNWAAIAIAGPRSRELLQRLEPDFDISNGAFPHMRYREGRLGGVGARIARISFSGELQYEIMVPSRYAAALVRALLTEEGGLAPRPVGMEAWLRLRLEKGYLHLGSDTDGRTTPLDVGMGPLVARRRDDFIGKRSLRLPFAAGGEREQMVGLTALQGMLRVGGRILSPGQSKPPCATEGYITSACFSPSVGQSIGLALVRGGHARHGETVLAYCGGTVVPCRISSPVFYDPGNERLQA
jgi:sarcosine oxidase, subunit alpha